MHWLLPSWTTATRSLQVLLATCKSGCSLCWMPLLGSSFLVGRQNTQPHCSGTFTGYAYWSESSFGCVFWHITVCMAQHRRILQTACDRHQSSSLVAIFALPTRQDYAAGAADSSCNSWRPRLLRWLQCGRGTVCQHRSGLPRRCCLFGGRQRSICFSCRTTDFWLLFTIVIFLHLICKVPL